MPKVKLVDLYQQVQSHIAAMGTSEKVMRNYRFSGFHPLQRFFAKTGQVYYSRKLADQFVADTLNAYNHKLISRYRFTCIRKVVAMLGEFANTGTIKWGYMTRYNATLLSSKQFETVFIQYHQMLNEGNRYASGTISGYKNSVKRFYLEDHGYRTLGRLNLQIVSDYISDTAQRIPCSISGILHALKSFFICLSR